MAFHGFVKLIIVHSSILHSLVIAYLPLIRFNRDILYSALVCVYHSADGLACDVKHEPHGIVHFCLGLACRWCLRYSQHHDVVVLFVSPRHAVIYLFFGFLLPVDLDSLPVLAYILELVSLLGSLLHMFVLDCLLVHVCHPGWCERSPFVLVVCSFIDVPPVRPWHSD